MNVDNKPLSPLEAFRAQPIPKKGWGFARRSDVAVPDEISDIGLVFYLNGKENGEDLAFPLDHYNADTEPCYDIVRDWIFAEHHAARTTSDEEARSLSRMDALIRNHIIGEDKKRADEAAERASVIAESARAMSALSTLAGMCDAAESHVCNLACEDVPCVKDVLLPSDVRRVIAAVTTNDG